ncbi:hypothetical protein ACCS66_04095 [Rhizobium ruizarguesonis]
MHYGIDNNGIKFACKILLQHYRVRVYLYYLQLGGMVVQSTRRMALKSALLGVFGTLSGSQIVSSAAAQDAGAGTGLSSPLTIGGFDGNPLLLTPMPDGKISVFEIAPKPGTTLPNSLENIDILSDPNFVLTPGITKDVKVGEKVLNIQNGILINNIDPKANFGIDWKETHWVEVKTD